jgi:hypothetical protein
MSAVGCPLLTVGDRGDQLFRLVEREAGTRFVV